MESSSRTNKIRSAIVIPARYSSSRFPGKPLSMIKGKSLLERTWRIAQASQAESVYIATDDERIKQHALGFGAQVLWTSESCRNGSERVFEALQQIQPQPDVVLNLQGDAVLTPPWVLRSLIEAMQDSSVQIATPAIRLSLTQYQQLVSDRRKDIVEGTFVVFAKNGDALYFSKYPIPYLRTTDNGNAPLYRHVGLYAYRYDALKKYLQLPPSPLEMTEGLEQLRALENGIPIRVVVVDYRGRTHASVDNPSDIAKVEELIDREGELCS